jgi:hypothetical protein
MQRGIDLKLKLPNLMGPHVLSEETRGRWNWRRVRRTKTLSWERWGGGNKCLMVVLFTHVKIACFPWYHGPALLTLTWCYLLSHCTPSRLSSLSMPSSLRLPWSLPWALSISLLPFNPVMVILCFCIYPVVFNISVFSRPCYHSLFTYSGWVVKASGGKRVVFIYVFIIPNGFFFYSTWTLLLSLVLLALPYICCRCINLRRFAHFTNIGWEDGSRSEDEGELRLGCFIWKRGGETDKTWQ